MSAERILAIGIFIFSFLLLVRLGPPAVRSWQIYAGTGRRRQEDASDRAPLIPPSVASRASTLEKLGYHRLGETRLVLPVGERFGWIVAADDAASYSILVDGPLHGGLTGMYSAWLDGTWLCTIHPRGEAVDRPNLEVRIVSGAIEEAVALHRTRLEAMKQLHGPPRPIRTMRDMLALDADYRTRFGGSRLLPLTMRIVLPAVGVAIIVVLSLALMLTAR